MSRSTEELERAEISTNLPAKLFPAAAVRFSPNGVDDHDDRRETSDGDECEVGEWLDFVGDDISPEGNDDK